MTSTTTRDQGRAAMAAIEDHAARSVLATGWVAVALMMLFRDVHELFRPGLIDEMRTGVVNGTAITDGLLVAAGIGVLVLVAMPLVVRLAPWRTVRVAVLVAAPMTLATVVAGGIHDADDVLFLVAEVALLSALVVRVLRHGRRHP